MSKLVFDIEADGLLTEATRSWCLVTKNLVDDEVCLFTNEEVRDSGLDHLAEAKILIGHNICGFDLPLLKKLYDWEYSGKLRDTLCMSKLFQPERPLHGLASWGQEFGRDKPEHEDWSQFSSAMLYRCSEDVEINALTYKFLVDSECRDWDWVSAIELEQQFAMDQAWQEVAGVDIDVEGAEILRDNIDIQVDGIDARLHLQLPLSVVNKGPVNRPFKKDGSYSKMVHDWMEVIDAGTSNGND